MSELACAGCDYTTTEIREGMDHACDTGHELSGPGALDGTTLTISFGPADDYDEDDGWNAEDQL